MSDNANDKRIHSKKLRTECDDYGIDTPRVMNQEWIDFILDCRKIDNKVQEVGIINTEYNIISGITWLGGHDIINKDVVSILFKNISLKSINMESIIIKENVLEATFKDSHIAEAVIQENNRFNTLIIKNCNIGILRIEWSRVNRILLYNSEISNLIVSGSMIPFGILMNYNSSINRLYMNGSFINNESNKGYNEAYNDKIKDADDIIMDDKLIDIVKYEVKMHGSSIIETRDEGELLIQRDLNTFDSVSEANETNNSED